MDEATFKTEMRLFAIEYVLQDALKLFYLAHQLPAEFIEQRHANVRQGLARETIPGADAATADAAMSEIGENVERLLGGAEKMVAEARKLIRPDQS